MSASQADRNLLLGVLALQMDFISRDALIAAMNAWTLEKSTSLGEILVRQGALADDAHSLLTALVAQHIALHRNDPQQSLAALQVPRTVQLDLKQIQDADVQCSIVQIVGPEPSRELHATLPPRSLPTGDSERFEILRLHAMGGLGEVLVARDLQVNRDVALKRIHDRYATSADRCERFLMEAQITGGLEHPGIVPVYGLGTSGDGRPYYAMRLIGGETLGEAIRQFHATRSPSDGKRRIRLRQLLGRFIAVCNAVEYAHSRGVVHRDIKPGNIMLGKYGETVVVDWGLAKVLGHEDSKAFADESPLVLASRTGSSETLPGSAIGTPAFMSPEQAEGRIEDIGPASDIYSLGATLYVLLTGREPFEEAIVGVVLAKVQQGDFTPPRERDRSVAPPLNAICLKAMQREPENRYQSASDLANDIEHWLADEPVSAYRDPWSVRTARWIKRHRVLAASAAALMAALFISLAVGTAVLGRANARIAAQAAATRRQLYISQMNIAHGAWEDNNAGRVSELLELQIPKQEGDEDFRGWEWHYLWRLTHSEMSALPFKSLRLAVSPDGRFLVSGDDEGLVKIWKTDGFQPAREFKAHDGRVGRLAISRDGRLLLTRGRDGRLKLWDMQSGQQSVSIPVSQRQGAIALSPDGVYVAAATSVQNEFAREIGIWSTSDGTLIRKLGSHSNYVSALSFSPGGEQLISGSWDGTVGIWDVSTGNRIRSLQGQGGNIICMALSSDGRRLITGGRNGAVKQLDLQTGRELFWIQAHTQSVTDLAFSPDGLRFASSSNDTTVKLCNSTTGRELTTLRGHASTVNAVVFSLTGESVVSGSWDQTIRIWDAASNQTPWSLKIPGGVTTVAYSPDGNYLAAGSGSTVAAFDASTGRELWSESEQLNSWVAGTSNAIRFTPDSRQLACGRFDGKIHFRAVENGRVARVLEAHNGKIAAVAFSPDGKLMASCSSDRSAAIWNLADGSRLAVLEGHTGGVTNVSFSPDGRLLATTGAEHDNTVRLWDVATGRELRSLAGHIDAVYCAEFSFDGRLLFTGGRDEMVYVWNVETGERIRAHRGHAGNVSSLSLSPDGTRLATCSNDMSVKIWDAATLQELQTLKPDAGQMHSIAFHPDGLRLACAAQGGSGIVWDARPLTPELRADLNRSEIYAEPLAQELVNALFETKLLKEDVLSALSADATLSEIVRKRAVEFANRRGEDPLKLNNRSWSLAVRPLGKKEDYENALRYAEAACDQAPDSGVYLNTLGVAQYRAGRYPDAAATLTRSDEINRHAFNGAVPADVLFLAIAHFRLGHSEEAVRRLDEGRQLFESERWKNDAESQAILQEAESLISASIRRPVKAVRPRTR